MPVQISENRSLRSFLTFGMEARATQFVEVTSVAELREALELETENKLILGGGSNVLFVEEFDGLVIRNCIKGIEVLERDQSHVIISVGAGEIWHDLVSWCLDQDFGGLENLSLIPGTVGAAPIQNIGAYGVEQDEVIVSLDAVDMSTGERITFDKEACRFSYRDSIFKRAWKGQYCITKVRYKLTIHNHALRLAYGAIAKTVERLQIDEPTIKDVSAAVIGIRRSKLPDPKVLGNAGSFFKNPVITDAEFNQLKQRYPGLPSYPLDQGY
ncbi:MAG: UDP-N-acetylmuramate dehydrogenase, partial [Saprospiraceae bacterium]|nr:UDP-N-acetylmuramate dehydrogenase [Saprospiraceae bacterium]